MFYLIYFQNQCKIDNGEFSRFLNQEEKSCVNFLSVHHEKCKEGFIVGKLLSRSMIY